MEGSTVRTALVATLAIVAVASLGWWAAEEARYKRPDELDSRPYPLRAVDLQPPAARGGIEYFGKLRVDLFIGKDGTVDRIEVLESTLPAGIAQEALKAFSSSRWEAGTRAGRKVRTVKRVEIEVEPPAGARRPPMRPDS